MALKSDASGIRFPERCGAMTTEIADVTGVRLYTRGPVTLPWLARSVVPVARALHDHGSAVRYLRRGWLHGPHVDIVARGGMASTLDWPAFAALLDAGPLDAAMAQTDEAYLAQARQFGRLEAVPPPYLPMAEHGTVDYLGPDGAGPRDPVLAGLPEWAVVNTALSRPLLDTIDELAARPPLGPTRLAEAFLALADSHFLGLAHGVFSFRSHVEAFLAWAAPSGKDMRPVFAERLAREAPRLRPAVAQRLSGAVGPAAAAWRTAFAYCAGTLDSAVAGGTLTGAMVDLITATVDATGMGPPGAERVVPQGSQPDTDFHRAVAGSGALDDPTPWFAAYRVLINLFYQQLPLLTVSPLQRYYMCYAISELVDDELGESWQDRLRRSRVRVPETRTEHGDRR